MLKRIAFSLSGLLICLLVVATFLEPLLGTEVVKKYFYTSPMVICLWVVTVTVSVLYLFRQAEYKNLITFLLHFSFVIILAGALVTHLFGKYGTVHLRKDNPQNEFIDADGRLTFFDFDKDTENQFVKLLDFRVEYYEGTQLPKDFVSTIELTNDNDVVKGRVSMNKIFLYKNYRFYQQSYDEDGHGVLLSVCYDPFGIAITYCGYALLFFCLISFFFQKKTFFRQTLTRFTSDKL